MRHGIATVSLSGMLKDKLISIAKVGFDGVEIFENDLIYSTLSLAEVKAICHDLNLEIMLFQPFRDFEGCDRNRLALNLERARKKFDLMNQLGVDKILVCSNVQANVIRNDDIIMSDLYSIAEIAKEFGVEVGYEALAWGTYVNSYKQVWKYVKEIDHPNLGIILDSFHTLAIQDSLDEISEIDQEKITFVQLADAPVLQMNVLSWSRHFRNFPGQGGLAVPEFLAAILKTGYDRAISLEVFNDNYRSVPNLQTAISAKKSLLYLEEQTQKIFKTNHQNISTGLNLFQAKDHAQYQGIEFVEFSIGEEHFDAMHHSLVALGFTRSAKHQSKDVFLYKQGDIKIIINQDPESFASHYYLMHGPALCALAYKVKDADRALQRALSYNVESFSAKNGPNELDLTAIVAPNGMLQYFIDDSTDIESEDFISIDSELSNDLQNIDHISLGIEAESMDIWTLYMKAVLGFTTETEWVLPDPFGLVKSKVARSEEGNVRIPLNISDDKNTTIAKSMSKYQGTGLQHLSFATKDIHSTIVKLKNNGVEFLEIPINYYDDLSAKYGLSEAMIDQLKASNLLYDEEPVGGYLLHAYTKSFADRFFFEILERFNGYDAYGANNSSVRMIAQS